MADSFFTELKRRNVFKVGIAYLVLAWIVVQVTSVAVPALHLPEWVNSFVFFIGTLGFPFALFFAWAFEITPDGIKKESEISSEEYTSNRIGRKLDFFIIGLLVLGMGYFIYESRFQSSPEKQFTENNAIETEQQKNVANEPSSIAVLPFRDMSEASDQSFMGEGIADELLNALAQEEGLRVTARTSSFAFKNKEMTIAEIGEILSVSHILEGSIRRAGNRIRITAQLIDVKSSNHLWSKTYTKEMKDIFALEDEIVSAVHAELLEKLLGKRQSVEVKPIDPKAYVLYQKVKQQYWDLTGENASPGRKLLKEAIAIDPNYADAYAALAFFYTKMKEWQADALPSEEKQRLIKVNLSKALALNPDLALAHYMTGIINSGKESIEHYNRAIAINPSMSEAYAQRGMWLYSLGSMQESEADIEKAYQLNPIGAEAVNAMVRLFIRRDQYQLAEKALDLLLIAQTDDVTQAMKIEILMREGKILEAFEFIDELPNYSRYLKEMLLNSAGIYNSELAKSFFEDDWEKTYKVGLKEVKKYPTNYFGRSYLAYAMLKIGKKEDAFKEALEVLNHTRTYIRLQDREILVPTLLLSTLGRQDLIETELEELNRRVSQQEALKLQGTPTTLTPLDISFLGTTYCVLKRFDECVIELDKALELGHVTYWPQLDFIPALKNHAGYQDHRRRLDARQAEIREEGKPIIDKWLAEKAAEEVALDSI